jgi:serine/threonine protein kinase
MTTAYNFERDLLAKCRDRRLRRVVTPLADGSVQVPGNFGLLGNVAYVIFELASGDIRSEVANWQQFDLAWSLRSLHHTSTGLSQLHSAGIAHQDLKPSNVLVFPAEGAKVADLGRASYVHGASQVDALQIPGDVGYAPPEQWYGWQHSPGFDSRYVADLYLLGSLLFFYFMTTSAATALRLKLIKRQPGFTGSGFLQDLPYLQQAFSETISDLEGVLSPLAGKLTPELVMIARQVCEPDPRRRGDPNARTSGRLQHDIQAYISRFDRLAKQAELGLL